MSIHSPTISTLLSLSACAGFGIAGFTALDWNYGSKLFPSTVIAIAMAMSLAVCASDIRNLARMRSGSDPKLRPLSSAEMAGALRFGSLILGALVATLFIGQYLALVAFVGIYLQFWGRYSAKVILIYCAVSAAGLYGLFEVVVPVIWYSSPYFTLYYAPFACSIVPYIALTEAQAEFEIRPLNIRGKEQLTEQYHALNPKHKVPLLIVNGNTLTENVAVQR